MTLPFIARPTPSFRATREISLLFVFLVSLIFSFSASAQTTGTPPFGSFGGGPDIIDLANLNARVAIPIVNKAGRGMNYAPSLLYDTLIWSTYTSGSTTTWSPTFNYGWSGSDPLIGRVASTLSVSFISCPGHFSVLSVTYTNWAYMDGLGTPHPFPGTSTQSNACLPTTGFTSTASDGSGYTITVFGQSVTSLYSSSGNLIVPGTSIQDRNGNEITLSSGGVYTDTLGTTALAISGSGTSTSPKIFTYTPPNTTSAKCGTTNGVACYTVNYTNYTVATNFGVSGIGEYKSPAAVPLVTSVVLPDGSQYSFQYEATPGSCTPWSGTTCVTARVTQITLPTGGILSYAYTFSGCTTSVLSDGSATCLQRTTPDGVWTYAHSESGTAWTTLITDPQSNQTNMNFQGIYETQRQAYSGSKSAGTLLRQWTTCYNGNTSNCNATPIALPITQRNVTDQYGASGLQCQHIYKYNSVGGLTEQDDYDYGSGAPGGLLRQTLITFASLGNITAFRQQVTIKNGAGTTVSQTNYNYDETTPTVTSGIAQHASVTGSRGNLTSINYPVSGLTSNFTYYDTGSLNTSKDVNGAITTYNYSSTNNAYCQMAFPTSITEAISTLTQSYTWNCTGGVQTLLTDENGNNVTTSYSDPYFWRPASVTDQTGAIMNICYAALSAGSCPSTPSSNQVETYLNFNTGSSTVDSLTSVDGLGRVHVQQTRQSPSSSNFDSVETDYDSLGRPSRTTVPYVGTAGQTSGTAPAVTTTYDALSRVLSTSDAGGGSTSYTYNQNDVLSAIGPAPSGEGTKQRQLEYDSIGRLTSVCEITTILSGNGTCAQSNSQTGYWTKYSYDALGDLLTVTQNAQAAAASQQTRTYAYDAMSRLTSETNPESGTSAYTYDTITSGTCASTFKGDLIKRLDAVGNTTCYTYDTLHRPLSIAYTTTGTTVATPTKTFVYDSATISGNAMQYALGRLAEAYTGPSSAKTTDEGFSYTKRGEITDFYELTPHSPTSYYHASQTYWFNGAPNTLKGNSTVGIPDITYGVDGEGRTSTTSASTGPNPVTATAYNIFASPNQLSVTFGSGDSDVFSYDPNTMRMNKYQFKIGTQTVTGTLGWNSNGSLGSLNISDPFSPANTQNCAFTADDLARISKGDCGTIWGQSFSYDPFGNIQKTKITGSGATSFNPAYQSSPSITNRVSTVNGVSANYDANGNSTNDTFRTFTWDAENRPVTIGSVGLTYDSLGRVVEQSVSSTNSEIVYGPAGVKLALMNGTSLTKAFVPLTGGATAVYTSGTGPAYYRRTDHLGSSRFASTASQTLYSDTAYSPFGEPYASSGSIDNSFTGQNQDTTAGLYDFLFREQDPNQSRWTSPDPSGLNAVDLTNPQTLNRYAYVLNNPLTFIDPLGFDTGNDCEGGPCTDFSYQSGDCTVFITYHQETGADGHIYDMPAVAIRCPNGGLSAPVGAFGGGGGGGGGGNKLISLLRKIGNYIPTICGGGGFVYGGGRGSGGVTAVGVYGIKAWDSRLGTSKGLFGDITVGEGVQGGYGYAAYKDGSAEHFLFGGVGVDLLGLKVGISQYGSHVEGESSIQNQTGINVDIGTEGGGVGFGFGPNIDTVTSCFDHRGR
jgi:RHS repeat-associated protein